MNRSSHEAALQPTCKQTLSMVPTSGVRYEGAHANGCLKIFNIPC